MYLSNIQSSLSFGKIITGRHLSKIVSAPNSSNMLKYEFDKIESIAHMLNADSKDNVDIILEYAAKGIFFAMVSAKKGGVPKNNSFYKFIFSSDKRLYERFDAWVNAWDTKLSIHKFNDLNKEGFNILV